MASRKFARTNIHKKRRKQPPIRLWFLDPSLVSCGMPYLHSTRESMYVNG